MHLLNLRTFYFSCNYSCLGKKEIRMMRCVQWKKRWWWSKWCNGPRKNTPHRYFGKDKKGKALTLPKACPTSCKAIGKFTICAYTNHKKLMTYSDNYFLLQIRHNLIVNAFILYYRRRLEMWQVEKTMVVA